MEKRCVSSTQILKQLCFWEILSLKELTEEKEVDLRTIQRSFSKHLKDDGCHILCARAKKIAAMIKKSYERLFEARKVDLNLPTKYRII